MASATTVQLATLIFAGLSAVGSFIAGAAGYQQMRRTTRSPRVVLGWNETDVLVTVRNGSSSPRTAYSIGLEFAPELLRPTAYASIADPSPFSVNGERLPVILQPGERVQWRLPYGLLKVKYEQSTPLRRRAFRIAAELGEDRYAKRPRRATRKLIASASKSRSGSHDLTVREEGPNA